MLVYTPSITIRYQNSEIHGHLSLFSKNKTQIPFHSLFNLTLLFFLDFILMPRKAFLPRTKKQMQSKVFICFLMSQQKIFGSNDLKISSFLSKDFPNQLDFNSRAQSNTPLIQHFGVLMQMGRGEIFDRERRSNHGLKNCLLVVVVVVVVVQVQQ